MRTKEREAHLTKAVALSEQEQRLLAAMQSGLSNLKSLLEGLATTLTNLGAAFRPTEGGSKTVTGYGVKTIPRTRAEADEITRRYAPKAIRAKAPAPTTLPSDLFVQQAKRLLAGEDPQAGVKELTRELLRQRE